MLRKGKYGCSQFLFGCASNLKKLLWSNPRGLFGQQSHSHGVLLRVARINLQAVFGCHKIFSRYAIFQKGKYFQVFGCIMKMVVENIFMCCGSILKMLFSYKFFTFSQLFSQHPNKFYYKKFQNHSQIPTPHITETPIQPTAANSGNQKPQPPKHHYHTTTTTTKIKITERDRWVEGSGSKARSSGKIEMRGVIGVVL